LNKAFEAYIASVVSSLVLMVALTLLDVWVVYFLLIKKGLLITLPLYWWFPFWVMEFTFPLCLILMFENKIPLTCYLFFVLGGEDTLFYLLVTGHIPEVYHGIYFLGLIFSPTIELVSKTLILSFFLSMLIFYVEYKKMKRSLIESQSSSVSV
jgi:hypothetical protein